MNDIKTVADKIRSMNDEELVLLLSQISYEGYKNGYKHALHRKQMKGVRVTFDMMLNAHEQLIHKNAEEVSFGPMPGMGA